jgi:multidrug resistance protein, MATE family
MQWTRVIQVRQRDKYGRSIMRRVPPSSRRGAWVREPRGARRVGQHAAVATRRLRRRLRATRRHSVAMQMLRAGSVRLRATRVAQALKVAALAIKPAARTVAGSIGVPSAAPDAASAAVQRRVWALALPAIGEQVLALAVGLSDTFLSGHLSATAAQHLGYGRAEAVAAIGAASTVVWVVLTAYFAVNVGVTALVARSTGAKDHALAMRAAGQGIVLGGVAGLLVAALAAPLATGVTDVLGLRGQIAMLAACYIRVLSLALPATGIASAANAAMRGAGDTRRPMLVMLVVNGANILGSWLLLNGLPRLGVPTIGVIGSACGAASGWVLGAIVALAFLRRAHSSAPRLTRAGLHPHRETMLRILRVGLPSTVELVIFQIGVVTFVRVIVGLGPTVYAANVAINAVESIGILPAFGFSVAATALVGQALGAGEPDLAVRSTWATLRPCLVVVAGLGVVALCVPQALLAFFVADPSVLRAGDIAMRLSCLTLPASAVAFVFNGALRGAGDTRFPVVVRAAGTWGMRLPLAALLVPVLALPGGRLVMAMDFSTQAVLAYMRFRSGRWRRARV